MGQGTLANRTMDIIKGGDMSSSAAHIPSLSFLGQQ